ncbi:hypothetical protein FJK98_17190 [Micromonospora sp. HM134]|uniref:hypothetical protein n=1 Tax=Micromonospora sp. HM134 TaxID=2583243 RepID=UPI001198A0AF|nr:hypothetical protein FJK98_17190 [Micromonospora sp. HM134]
MSGPGLLVVGDRTTRAPSPAGDYHSLALQPDYTVVAWGSNGHGQLGDGGNEPRPTPVQVLAPQS